MNAYGARLLAMLRQATIGEYEIRGELGRGGMAAVYLAYDLRLNRKVAIKVMLPELAFHEGMEDRFKREARTAAKLDHPNIVVIHSVRDDAELLFFVMKFIEGAPLDQLVRRYSPLPIPVAQYVLAQLASALQYAHDEGVVHRDVKPANVLIDRRGNALVTDFGIAKATESPNLTRTGSVIGTPAYMSPEQCRGDEQTHASDQYSLGVVAYELITGQPPFVGPSVELQWAHVKTEPPPLLGLRPDCPPGLADAVMRMLGKDPGQRWPSLRDAMPSLVSGLVAGDDSPRAALAEMIRVVAPVRTDSIAVTPASPIPRGRSAPPVTPWKSILVAPREATIEVGEAITLAVAFQPTPPANVQTPTPVWTSSAPAIVTVSADGVATALAPGSAIITAQAGSLAASTTIGVRPAAVAAIQVKPLGAPLEVGETYRLECVVRDARGNAIADAEVDWASSNPRVVSVSATGDATALALGKATLAATSQNVSSTMAVEVVPDRVAEVVLSPATLTLEERGSARLGVHANNRRGKAIAGRVITLRTADVDIAAVGPDGRVIAKAVGRTTVSGTLDGHTGSAEVIVRPAKVAALAVTPQSPSIVAGETVTLTAALSDATGHPLTGRTVVWGSSDQSVVRVDRHGRATALEAGTADVTAECDGVKAAAHIIVAPPAITELVVAPLTAPVRVGKHARIRAKARDTTGRELEPDGVAWRSSDASVATVGPDGTITAIAPGDATIVAELGERRAQTSVSVVAAPPPRRIPIAVPIGGAIAVVAIVVAFVFMRGKNTPEVMPVPAPDPVPAAVVSGTPGSPAGTSPRTDSATTLTPPPDSTAVTSAPASALGGTSPVATLRVSSRSPLVIEVGQPSRVAVRATTSDGETVDAPKLSWSSAQPSIAVVSANGTVIGKAEGQTRITVSSGSVTTSVDVVVSRPTPAGVAIVASTNALKVGESTTLTARVRDRTGQALAHAVAWRSSNPAVASVDSGGTVRGVRRGDAIVFAVAGGATDSVRVSVTAPTPVVAATPTPGPASTAYSPGATTPPRPDERAGERTATNEAGNASVREVDAALVSAAQSIASGFARGQLGQLTATPAFAKSVREDTPRVDGSPEVRRRTVGDGKAEGEVTVPLRWRNFAGRDRSGTVVLVVTLELQGGTWRATSARNLNQP